MMKNMKIKSFIYLDDYKMYSFSSQLFEGITQYILNEESKAAEEQHEQKGSFFSGRFMADMMFQKNAQTEMRYLHDFAFNLFEKEMESRDMLFDVKPETTIEDLRDKGFVRVKGKIIFEDYTKILYTLDHFNEIGRAFGELQNLEAFNALRNFKSECVQTKDRELKNKQRLVSKNVEKQIEEQLKSQGLLIDENSRDNIHKILSFGYRNCYEVRMSMENSPTLYTAVINQEFLKEPETSLISKYSRLSEKEFTLIGVVSQAGNAHATIPEIMGNDLKSAVIKIVEQLAGLENQFNGRTDNECIIDPIGIFTEI